MLQDVNADCRTAVNLTHINFANRASNRSETICMSNLLWGPLKISIFGYNNESNWTSIMSLTCPFPIVVSAPKVIRNSASSSFLAFRHTSKGVSPLCIKKVSNSQVTRRRPHGNIPGPVRWCPSLQTLIYLSNFDFLELRQCGWMSSDCYIIWELVAK